VSVLRRQRWLFVWGLLALALQLAWAAGHVHQHEAGHHARIVFAAGDLLLGAEAGHANGHDLEDAGRTGSGGEEHPDAAHPHCATCWTQSLASTLALPVFPVLPLRRALRPLTGPDQSGPAPAFAIPRGFKARAPPLLQS
jgi:hypothetical protein